MELHGFVSRFAGQFEETDEGEFVADTRFHELQEWDSMIALSLIAMIDDEYGVIIGGNDILQSVTVEDLFNIVKDRKG